MMTGNTMPQHVRDALRRVLDYTMENEEEDYENKPEAERAGHIYESLMTLREWLDGRS